MQEFLWVEFCIWGRARRKEREINCIVLGKVLVISYFIKLEQTYTYFVSSKVHIASSLKLTCVLQVMVYYRSFGRFFLLSGISYSHWHLGFIEMWSFKVYLVSDTFISTLHH